MAKRRSIKIIAVVLLILAIAIAGIAILQIRKADKHKHVTFMSGHYRLLLFNDGRFGLGNLMSSFIGITDSDAAPDLYRWDGDTLILEYGDYVGVLYFQKEGDTLVFQREQSVFSTDPRYLINSLPDGTIFIKVEQ